MLSLFYCILISFIALVEKQLKLKLFVMMHNKNYNDFVERWLYSKNEAFSEILCNTNERKKISRKSKKNCVRWIESEWVSELNRSECVTLDKVILVCIVCILCWSKHKSFIAFLVLYEICIAVSYTDMEIAACNSRFTKSETKYTHFVSLSRFVCLSLSILSIWES